MQPQKTLAPATVKIPAGAVEPLLQQCRTSAAAVYVALFSNPEGQQPMAEIAARTGLNPKTVREAVRDLVRAGLITVQHVPAKPSRYVQEVL